MGQDSEQCSPTLFIYGIRQNSVNYNYIIFINYIDIIYGPHQIL